METLLAAMVVAGFASGVHCAAMCGGFAAALGQKIGTDPIFLAQRKMGSVPIFLRQLALSAGRITSYAAAGVDLKSVAEDAKDTVVGVPSRSEFEDG